MTKLTKYLLVVFGLCAIALIIIALKFSLSNTPALQATKSILTPQAKTTKNQTMTFMVAGDAMFGRAVYNQFHDNLAEAFLNLGQGFFSGQDIALLNLEGPLVRQEFMPDTNPDNLIMKFPPQTKDALLWLGINTAGLANNHTGNQGQINLDFTRDFLNQAQIATVGDPQNETDIFKTFTKDNLKITIFAINILANTPDLVERIKEQKDNQAFVIIYPHWGEEYQTTHSASQENLAHAWIDAGADLIIGSHPHVIQDTELYRNKAIFYSLGNFLFDQTFSQITQEGLVIKGKIKNNQLTLELIPIVGKHLRLSVMEGERKDTIINQLKKGLGLEGSPGATIELKIK